ncbi:efflux transporter periplasmic adaptor subunit [Rheinheimera sp. SA_1]|uniref:efflux RND transporter periplasmic adaptor subunit n=1 Tax=Rheinheimera sp. SA_1 TaxID=1827365 RepID=UPI0007FD4B2C|nr:HlyD family efflux transporter periplasmic adaptor subunit [Rheinheimera sp. SA_1]OBP15451.1 efflux transporter periplasmic adaptor subunit [Rheinheimera sp. SA_1]
MIQGTAQQDIAIKASTKQNPVRKILLVGAVAGTLWLSWQWLFAGGAQASLVIPRQQVQIGTVSRGDFVRDLAVHGKVVAANAPTLFSQQAGQIRLLKQPGEPVTLGDLLAVIDSPTLENEVKQQQALLASMTSDIERATLQAREQQLDMEQVQNTAQINLLAAKRELARAKQSLQLGVLRQLDLDIANDKMTQAELEFAHAKRKVQLALDKLAFEQKSGQQALERQQLVVAELNRKLAALQIKAPVTGQVGNWLVEQQNHVLEGQGLLTVIDLSQYEAELSVPENYAAELATGLAVEVSLNGQLLQGALSHVAPEVKEGQVSARVRFQSQDAASLRQNQRLSGRIIFEQKTNVLKVARGDFISSGGGRQAYRLIDNVATKTPVELGAVSVQWVEVLAGVNEGDQLVISNLSEFKDQPQVRLN